MPCTLAIAIVLAVVVYRPFEARPFEFLDFPEFFGVLERGAGFAERVHGLVAYYETQGRANVLAYALIAVRWTLFGQATIGWQVTRFLVMSGLVGVTYLLLRRFGSSRLGSAAGASLFLTTEAAAHGWLRLSMMEPLAALFVYSAALLACRYQRVERWATDLVGISVLVGAAVLTKEVIVAAIPLVAMTGLFISADGSPRVPRRSRRNAALLIALLAVVAITLVPTLTAVLAARTDAYAASYGSTPLQFGRIVAFLFVTLVPFDILAPNIGALLALSSYLLIAIAGLSSAWRRATERRTVTIPLTIGAIVALGGALVYSPWPNFQSFYTIPYLLAPALVIAISVTTVERYHHRARWATYAGLICISCYAVSFAHAHARRTAASQRLVDRTAVAVSDIPNADSAIFAVAVLNLQAWQGTGPTIARYATAVRHVRFPGVRDEQCENARTRADTAGSGTVVIVLSSQCRPWTKASRSLQEDYRRWSWTKLGLVKDSLRADFFRSRTTASAAARVP